MRERDTSYHSPFPEVRSDSRSDRNNGDQSGLGRDLCGPRDPKGRGLQRNGAIKGSMGGEREREVITINALAHFL